MIPLFVTMNLLPAGLSRETPPDWEHSGRTIDAFVNRMLRAGFYPTLFASPEATRAHAPMLEEFTERGCEVGVLVAPNQSPLLNEKKPFGALSPDDQMRILLRARELFYDYMGYAPRVVRTGLYSGDETIFARCKAAGFSHSSIRLPGAQLSTIHTVWPINHTIDTSQIIDIPVSTNPDERLFNRYPVYLSPDFGTSDQISQLTRTAASYGHLCLASSTATDYYNMQATQHDNIDAFILATDEIVGLQPMRITQWNA